MGFSAQKYHKEQQERRWKINPVWRGIGCFLIILVPIMSWFAAQLFLQTNNRLALSSDLTKIITIRYLGIAEIDKLIASFNNYTAAHDLVTGQFLFTVILMFIGFGLLSVIYAILYRIVGPPRYGPFDIPPGSLRR